MNKFTFIDRDPHCQTHRVKEAIDIIQPSNNINRDNGIEIPEAWMLTTKKHKENGSTAEERTTSHRNNEDQVPPIAAHYRVTYYDA